MEGQRHVIAGYIHNHYRHPITDVHVRVEIFDASGEPMGDTHATVAGEVPPGGRGYFVVSVPAGGAAFGVTVHSFTFAPVQSP
ncbi:MAG: hypothetical protein HYU41_14855 [Candidatus Rokubacteria bacterium]|nr:hypothetical protein [Candidatus Rokubacteria bacterium]